MITPYVVGRFAYVDGVIAKCLANSSDVELASYFSAFLVVLLSGMYEDCVEHLLALRAAKAGDVELAQYVSKTIGEIFRNPTFGKIVEILGKFSQQYADQLRTSVQPQDAQALDNVVSNKNLIAHGRPSQATLRDVEKFHKSVSVIFGSLEVILA